MHMDIKPSVNKNQPAQRRRVGRLLLIKNWAQLAAVVVVLLVAVGFIVKVGVDWSVSQRIDTSAYQVVYLNNGQAYFGKLQNTGGDYLVMKSPYTAQSVKDSTSTTDATTTLLRVRDQIYGPQDSIAIKSSQVAFWQNLRSDSKVSTAIDAKTK